MAKSKSTIAARRTTRTRSSSGGKQKGAQQTTAWKRDQGDKREVGSDAVEIDDQDIVESTYESDGSEYQEEDAEASGGTSEEDSDEELGESDSDFEAPAKRKGKRQKTKTSRQRQGRPLPAAKAPVEEKRDGEQRGGGTIKDKQEPASADRSSTAAANEAASHATAREEPGRLNSSTPVKEAVTPATVNTAAGGKEAMTYVWEIAKTSRAMCRRCDDKISKGALKIGVVTEGSWGPSTQWHHLQCTVFRIKKAEEIEGFNDLDDALLPILEEQVKKSQGETDDMYDPITPDDLVRKEWSEKAQCPRDVMATLLPYQQEGLAWMLNQEKLDYKGGILADEMGMGKTLQAICTIVANRPNALDETMQQRWAKSEAEMCGEGASATKRGGTLVVCPTIALKQWQSELARFVKPGTLKVVIHHGANRATRAEDLMKADVILTTYAIVENEHRKAFASAKVSCPDCGRSLYPDKMFVHRKYFCGESAQMTEAQAKTQRKGKMAPWRRRDANEKLKKKGVKGNKMEGDVADSDSNNGGTTDIKVKVRGKTRGSKTRGSNRGGRSDGSDGSESGDGGMTKLNVRVRASAKARRSTKATGKGNGHGKAGNKSSGEKDSAQRSQTDITRPARKRRKSAGGVVEDRTTDISGRRGKKGNKAAKGKGAKRKKAAGESESDWSGDSSSDDDADRDDDAERSTKEAAFAKVLRDMMARKKDANPGVLQEISWQRIMLDEAHMIKDRSTSTAKAVFALTSLFKWCLTGTPLQNRVGELYSLVRFLRMDPHAFYGCRKTGCECKSLNYRFGPEWRACEECGHTPIMHYAYFNRHILNPISRTGYVGEGKKAFLRLKREVMDEILLRRTKANRSSDICLPPRIVRVRQHRLDEREEDFYQALYTQSQAQFDTYVDSGTILNNYAHIFDILIRLRQAVDHPYLVIYSSTKREGMTPAINPTPPPTSSSLTTQASRINGGPRPGKRERGDDDKLLGDTSSDSSDFEGGDKGGQVHDEDGEDDVDDCGICSEPAERPVSAACSHIFCRACVQELIDTAPGDINCPLCSEPLTVDLSGDNNFNNQEDEARADELGKSRGRQTRAPATRGRRPSRSSAAGGKGGKEKERLAGMVASLEASLKNKKKTEVVKKNAPYARGGAAKRTVTKHSVINKIDLSKFQSSTKMEALMEEVHLMQERDPAAKALVFSQFVNMLDLIEYRMHKGRLGCRKLSGHLSIQQRDQVLKAFQNDPEVKVLLISLKAGGVALNLTVANHIFLMDPWWNPAAEMQAIDRTHRLGQFKPIYATRFIIEDTVEERIIKLQEKKQLVFDSTVGGSAESTGKLTVDDLRFLFAH